MSWSKCQLIWNLTHNRIARNAGTYKESPNWTIASRIVSDLKRKVNFPRDFSSLFKTNSIVDFGSWVFLWLCLVTLSLILNWETHMSWVWLSDCNLIFDDYNGTISLIFLYELGTSLNHKNSLRSRFYFSKFFLYLYNSVRSAFMLVIKIKN